jgi:hypothetical protein
MKKQVDLKLFLGFWNDLGVVYSCFETDIMKGKKFERAYICCVCPRLKLRMGFCCL